MLTVWTICWGDKYPDYYVKRLRHEVAKHLSIPHRFICITNRQIDGVLTMPFFEDYPGWWSKIGLFKPGVGTAYNLWLDLDVVITGDLDDLVYDSLWGGLSAPTNWAQSGHGGVQSSVMTWRDCEEVHQIYNLYDKDDPSLNNWPPVNKPGFVWGDQEFITVLRDKGLIEVRPIRADWVKSYKYHCRGGLPAGTKIVVFHGEPKPADVQEKWFKW